MKVALLTFMYGNEGGGASILVHRLCDSLLEQGIKVVIITSRRESGLEKTYEEGVTIYRFRPRNIYWVGDKDRMNQSFRVIWQMLDIWNYHSYRIVKEILKVENPDLVHTHKLRGLSPSVWAAAKVAGGFPLVHTCHDYELMSPVGTLEGSIGRWADNGQFPFNLYQRLRARFTHAVDVAVAPSASVLQKHIKRGFFCQTKQTIIPNTHGYNLAKIEKNKSRLHSSKRGDDELRVLFLGRVEPEKGVLTLVDAHSRVIDSGVKISLDFVGSGSSVNYLRTQSLEQPKIRVHGPLFDTAKERLLEQADVVVVPSEVEESFGLVVVEALAFGKPVVVTNMGALPTLVKDSITGFIIKPFDPDGLAQLMVKLAKNSHELREMSDACFDAAHEYSIEQFREAYLDVYRLAGRE